MTDNGQLTSSRTAITQGQTLTFQHNPPKPVTQRF
jgi:hypothetical protein